MPAKLAMLIAPASTQSAPQAGNDEAAAAEMAARIASGPGFWTDWLAELGRQGLLEELLADGVIDAAPASAARKPPVAPLRHRPWQRRLRQTSLTTTIRLSSPTCGGPRARS